MSTLSDQSTATDSDTLTPYSQPDQTVKIVEIGVAEIKLDSEYLRVDTDVETLKKSIASVGLIHPLTVNQDKQLLAGARRLQALRELGWKTVPVQMVERDVLVQELISIDENLVRSSLRPLELEKYLNRGREIYESLHPAANKLDLTAKPASPAERREQEEQDTDSFAAVTAEKTGLSRSIIQGAIKRDALASEGVKRARSDGELNATKTNEIIKLEKSAQEQILPLVANKTAKETRQIVEAALDGGLAAAQEVSEKVVPLPREYRQMLSPIKRINRSINRILVEELRYEGPEQAKINNELMQLKNNLDQYFKMADIS